MSNIFVLSADREITTLAEEKNREARGPFAEMFFDEEKYHKLDFNVDIVSRRGLARSS